LRFPAADSRAVRRRDERIGAACRAHDDVVKVLNALAHRRLEQRPRQPDAFATARKSTQTCALHEPADVLSDVTRRRTGSRQLLRDTGEESFEHLQAGGEYDMRVTPLRDAAARLRARRKVVTVVS